jgi:hypothetical protein
MFKTVEQRIDNRADDKRSNLQLISLYHDIPQEELTVDEFEMMALDRLQLLRGIEVLQTRGFDGKELNNKIYAVSIYDPSHGRFRPKSH